MAAIPVPWVDGPRLQPGLRKCLRSLTWTRTPGGPAGAPHSLRGTPVFPTPPSLVCALSSLAPRAQQPGLRISRGFYANSEGEKAESRGLSFAPLHQPPSFCGGSWVSFPGWGRLGAHTSSVKVSAEAWVTLSPHPPGAAASRYVEGGLPGKRSPPSPYPQPQLPLLTPSLRTHTWLPGSSCEDIQRSGFARGPVLGRLHRPCPAMLSPAHSSVSVTRLFSGRGRAGRAVNIC